MTSHLVKLWLLVPLLNMVSALGLPGEDIQLDYNVNKIEACPEHPNLPHSYMDMHIEMDPDTDDLYVSGKLNATEPLRPGTKATVKIMRCLDETDKSCEKYLDIDIDDFCKHLPEKDKKWSNIVDSLKGFDPHCPVKPGVYELFEAPLSTKNDKAKHVLVGHWMAEVIISFEGKIIACLRGDAEIRPKRGRSRRK